MIDTPVIAQSPAQPIAFIPLVIPRDQIQVVMGPGLQEVFAALGAQDQKPTGPWFSHHLRMNPKTFDFRICVPVARAVKPVGRVQAGERAAAKVARTTYHGGYEGLGEAWPQLRAWVDAQGLKTREDLWEVYVKGPEASPNPADWRTELNWPLIG